MTDSMWTEPEITINGKKLSIGETMTVRVALESFVLSLNEEGLGPDAVDLTSGYLKQARSIMGKVYGAAPQ